MAQQSSVPGPPCAVHRYCHSPAFISGQVCLVQLVNREVMSGVRSMGRRLSNSSVGSRRFERLERYERFQRFKRFKLNLGCAEVLDGGET